MLYSTEIAGRRVRHVRAELVGSARAVAGAMLATRASGSAAHAGRSREQAPSAAGHPPGGNRPRAPPADASCPCWSTGQERNWADVRHRPSPAISDHYQSANDRDVTMLATA
jgi:hypothetical protein